MFGTAASAAAGLPLLAEADTSPRFSSAPPTAASALASTIAKTEAAAGGSPVAGEAAASTAAKTVSEEAAVATMLTSGGVAAGGGTCAVPCMQAGVPYPAAPPAVSAGGPAAAAASPASVPPHFSYPALPSPAVHSMATLPSPPARGAAAAAATGAAASPAAAWFQREAQASFPSSAPILSGVRTPDESLCGVAASGVRTPAVTCRSLRLLSFSADPVTAAAPPTRDTEILRGEEEATAAARHDEDASNALLTASSPASPSAAACPSADSVTAAATGTPAAAGGGEGGGGTSTKEEQPEGAAAPSPSPSATESVFGSPANSAGTAAAAAVAVPVPSAPLPRHAAETAAAAGVAAAPAAAAAATAGTSSSAPPPAAAAAASSPGHTYRLPATWRNGLGSEQQRHQQQQQQQQQQEHGGRGARRVTQWEPLRLGGVTVFPMGGGYGGETVLRSFLVAKLAAAVFTGMLLILAIGHLSLIGQAIKQLLQEIRSLGKWSPLAFFVAYTVLVMVFVPAEALNVAGGFIFVGLYGNTVGLAVATACCMAGLLTASAVCVSLSRYVFSGSMQRLFRNNELYQAFQLAVEEGGTCFVALVRLSPVLPFAITCYLFGLTPITLQQLLVGSLSSIVHHGDQLWGGCCCGARCLFILVCCCVYLLLLQLVVFFFNCMGAALKDVNDVDISHFHWTWKQSLLGLFGVLMALISIGYIGELTRRKLAEASEAAAQRRLQQQMLLPAAEAGEVVTPRGP